MDVSWWVWAATLAALAVVLTVDLVIVGRRPHEPSLGESTAWVSFYVALAVGFGLLVLVGYGSTWAAQFYTGWVVEYSLSIDNIFIFLLIMTGFAVPRQHQQRVLLVGIILALVLRGIFIAIGAVLVSSFLWIFYLFGAFLIYTGVQLLRRRGHAPVKAGDNALVRLSRRVLPMSNTFDGPRLTTRRSGRWLVTPMLLVMIAIGTADVVFAVDSIPAIFGITREPFLVFAANAFALMGLRQLYFLVGGLVQRLIYLQTGLAAVLCFIGGKMMVEALAENNLPFVNGGEPVSWAPHLPIWLSLVVIIGLLAVTAVVSLLATSRGKGPGPAPGAGKSAEPAEG